MYKMKALKADYCMPVFMYLRSEFICYYARPMLYSIHVGYVFRLCRVNAGKWVV